MIILNPAVTKHPVSRKLSTKTRTRVYRMRIFSKKITQQQIKQNNQKNTHARTNARRKAKNLETKNKKKKKHTIPLNFVLTPRRSYSVGFKAGQ